MSTLLKILAVALLISVGFNLWQWYNPRQITTKGKVVYLPGEERKVIIYDNADGTQTAKVKASQEYKQATKEARELIAAVKGIPDLESVDKIASLATAKMNLELELNAAKMTVNDVQNQRKTWEDKYNKVVVDNANNTTSVTAEVNPIIATVDKREAFYKPKESYTVITSKNPAVKFYGLESYQFKNPRPKDFVELNLKLQGLYINKTVIPYAGAELLFNPDGRLKPLVGYGYFYDPISGKMFPYGMAGVQLNVIRF